MKTKILTVAIAGGLVVTGNGLHQAKAASFSNPADAARAGIGQAYTVANNDCSGFTKRVFAQFGVTLPHNSAAQSHYGTAVSASNLQPGDLVFFNTSGSGISHVGIYVGNNRMISSENSTVGVRETQIFGGGASSYWQPRFVTARRIVTNGAAKAATQTQSQNTATSHQSSSTTTSTQTASSPNSNSATSEQQASTQSSNSATSEQQTSNQSSSVTSSESQSSNQNSNATSSQQTADSQPAVVASANQPAASTSQEQSTTSQSASAKVQAVSSSSSHAVNKGVYIVTAGDSLWAIANHTAGLTVTKIQKLNHLNGTMIYPGQKLILKTPVETHTIKSGDTLWKIAKDHGTTVKQLITDNHLTSDLIFPNRVLNIPQQ